MDTVDEPAISPRASNASPSTSGALLERRWWPALLGLLVLLDALLVLLGGSLAYQVRFCTGGLTLCTVSSYDPGQTHPSFYWKMTLLYVPLCLMLYTLMGAYQRGTLFRGTREYERIFNGTGLAILLTEFCSYLYNRHYGLARGWLVLAWLFGALAVAVGRFGYRRTLRALHRRGLFVLPTLVVGAGHEGQILEWHTRSAREEGLLVLGYVADALPVGSDVAAGLCVLGTIADLPALIERHQVAQVLVATADLAPNDALRVLQLTLPTSAQVALAPDLFRTLTTDSQLVRVAGDALLLVNRVRITGFDAFLKGTLDLVGSVLLLLLTVPVCLVITVALLVTSRESIFERYPVIGASGRRFSALKFRTTRAAGMASDTPEVLARRSRGLPVRAYPEVTPLGRLLRRYSLDELPQLLNVFAGQMSLVGPYKISPDQASLYGMHQLALLSMKPGITGVCQIYGRGELTIEERALLDAEYVRSYSIWRDLQILIATVPAVVHGHGAY